MLACIACVKQEEGGGGHGARDNGDAPTTCRDPVKSLTTQLKDMVLKLSGTHRQQGGVGGGGGGPRRRGGSPPPTRTTSLYRSGYYRPGVVQDDMAVPPATYLGHGASSTASSTPAAWERPPGNGESAAARGEWVAQVEPGVQITFVSLSGGAGAGGGNDLKRIRFSREMYDKWQAQRWWAENNERIMELYNVRRFSRHDHVLPPSSDAGDAEQRESFYSQMGSTRASSPAATPSPASATWAAAFARAAPPPSSSAAAGARQHSFRGPLSPPPPSSSNPSERAWQQKQSHQNEAGAEPARTTTSSCRDDDASVSELEVTEWVIQDQPGVYITVRELPDGARELRRVRFSREKFAELNAKLWWEENKERIHAQYL